MTTVFTKIIEGTLPGRIVWEDPDVVAFLSIAPLTDGHTLVVPRQEVDRWTDAGTQLLHKLTSVAHTIGKAQLQIFQSVRIGLSIAGFEVPHLHIHVWPVNSLKDFDFERADPDPDPLLLDEYAERLRSSVAQGA